ncbi:MAG: transposase, partial [Cyanobacteriota bacterium]|nr:transposase [Cyanobacteriota bacterium]
VQFCVDLEESFPENNNSGMIGIDLGLEYFYSDSQGKQVDHPRFLRKAEKSIKHCQRQIYSKKKGSNNRKKASKRAARKHLKVQRQREEFCKRKARNLCWANAKVVIEDLNVSGMVRNHKLAKSISDAAWSTFVQWLEYFGQKLGCEIIKVAPHFTSQICSKCGEKTKKSLSQRTHKCKHCGHIENRDVNAAKVILSRGIDQLPEGIREVTLRETFTSTNLSESLVLASDVNELRIP